MFLCINIWVCEKARFGRHGGIRANTILRHFSLLWNVFGIPMLLSNWILLLQLEHTNQNLEFAKHLYVCLLKCLLFPCIYTGCSNGSSRHHIERGYQ